MASYLEWRLAGPSAQWSRKASSIWNDVPSEAACTNFSPLEVDELCLQVAQPLLTPLQVLRSKRVALRY